jgi:hypothetical protein
MTSLAGHTRCVCRGVVWFVDEERGCMFVHVAHAHVCF